MPSDVSQTVLDSLRAREEFLRQILASTEDCIKILGLGARVEFMSENGMRALAIPDFDLVRDADWLAFWHGEDRAAAERAVAAARAGGSGQFEGYFETLAGEPKWFHVVVSPMLGADGTPERLLAVSRDITAARRDRDESKRNAERLALLVGAGTVLSSSLDYATTLSNVAQLAVQAIATFCFVDLIAEDGSIERVAWAQADETWSERLTGMARFAPRRGNIAHPVARAIATRTSVVIEKLSDADLRGSAIDGEHYALIRAMNLASMISVPLIASGNVLGALTMCLARDDGRRYHDSDRSLCEDLANRAAVAIAHAQLYSREHQVATALQEAALPRSLPVVAGVAFDAVYLPGKNEAEIGGDWYDAFVLADGRVVISIGDVLGSGLHAAVTMTKIREAIRTAALADPDPAAVLALADLALKLDDPEKIATAMIGLLDPEACTLACAAAGHPGPLMHVPGAGVSDPFSDRELPLGLRTGELAASRTIALPPGAFLTFFTDGLVESTRDALEGETRLRAALADPAVRAALHPAAAIRDAVLYDGARDDVAILTVALSPG